MKTTRRIITLVLALTLALALAIPAMAAEGDGKIAVTGNGTTTYEVYKIFDIEEVANGYKYKLAAGWETFTAAGYFTVENGYAIWAKDTTSVADAAAIAQQAKNFVATKSLTTAISVSVGQTIDVAPGYYLLVPANGPCGVTLVEANKTATVEEKTEAVGHPIVEKLVQEDSTQTYGKANDADIGQTINFQTTITAGVNADKYILHDLMDEHIQYTNAFTVTRDGNTVEAAGNYEIIDNPDDGCTFHMVFSDALCKSLADDAKLVVRYTGKLSEDALTGVGHENKTWLTYTESAVPSNESITTTMTYKITVNKVDNATPANPLAGAGFILRDNVGLYYKWNNETKAVEWVAKEQATPVVTGENGIIEFVGVDAENFTLEEVIVPNGYTGTTDVAVSTKAGDHTVTVVNTLGEKLPETGGIGTTIFYVLGGILVVSALAVLVVAKRRENAVQ